MASPAPARPWKRLAQCTGCVRRRGVAPAQHRWRPDGPQHKKGLMAAGYRRSFLRAINVVDLFPFLAGNKMPFKNEAKELIWLCLRSEYRRSPPPCVAFSAGCVPVPITPAHAGPGPQGKGN